MNGKQQNTFIKPSNSDSNYPTIGVKNLNFAHESSGGETEIDFNNLNTPIEWLESGLGNPNSQYIISKKMSQFRKNVSITSSMGYTIQKSEYMVYDSKIVFKNYASQVQEVFEISVSDVLVGGNRTIDGSTFNLEGTTLNSEIYLGKAFKIDPEQLMVFLNGQQIFKNDNNANDNSGNYYYKELNELKVGTSSTIVLNYVGNLPIPDGTPFKVISLGTIIEDADISLKNEVERLQGQLDAVIPTVADLASVPESSFRGAPNSVDLTAFANRVRNIEVAFNNLLAKLDNDSGVNDTDYESTLEL